MYGRVYSTGREKSQAKLRAVRQAFPPLYGRKGQKLSKKVATGKILLAKAGGIVYKYSIYQTFAVMKKYLLPLALAAFGGSLTASALEAEHIQVALAAKATELKVETVNPPVPAVDLFGTKRTAAVAPWYCVRVPLQVQGKARGSKKPDLVDKMQVRVYVVFVESKTADPIMLGKEITYVDIPLNPGTPSDKPSEGDMVAGVFISPADAAKILGGASKIDFSNKLVAVAVDATHKDEPCMKAEAPTDQAVVIRHEWESKLNGKWWLKKSKKNAKAGAVLRAISETPFAPFYAPAFPATSPLYGPAEDSAPKMGEDGTDSLDGSGASTSSSADDTAAGDDTPAEETGKKRGKNKKNK